LSPIQNTSYPFASLGSMGLPSTEKHLPHPTCSSITQGNFSRLNARVGFYGERVF